MGYRMGSGQKLCATCEYWMGERHPDFMATGVELENQNVKGKCFCLNGPHARAERYSNFTSCSKYKKWSVLK